MSLSESQQKEIQDFCFSEPKTISQICEKLKLVGAKALKSVYNFFTTQKAKLLFFIEKSNGFVWVRTNPLYFFENSTRLDTVISKPEEKPECKPKTTNGNQHSKIKELNRASPERLSAILLMNRIYKFGQYNKETKQFEYTTNAKEELNKKFWDYCARVKSEKIVMSRAPDNNPIFASDLIIPYKTRFTDQGRQQSNLNGFKRAYSVLSSRHMKGVFLTLTAKPDRSKTLWEANKQTLQAWGKFQQFLTKVLPDRADWICVREFQQNGRLHFHILIAGVNWLATKKLIQYTWVKYGGGEILDIHTIHQDPLNGWLWSRSSPADSNGMLPMSYLENYLEKSMSSNGGSLYWVMGCRNWTCSKSLLPKQESQKQTLAADKNPKKLIKKAKYVLKGVLSSITGFRASHRKDSLTLFAQSPITESPKTVSNISEHSKTKPKLNLTFQKASELYIKNLHSN